MSSESEELEGEGTGDEVCASCGVAAVDDTKLKKCACGLVKYCSADCQKNHRSRHKKACKKRLAEMHDKQLFTQNDISHREECPICCLPLSIDLKKSIASSTVSFNMSSMFLLNTLISNTSFLKRLPLHCSHSK